MELEELYAKAYIDEGITPVFASILRNNGIDVMTADELGNKGWSDEQQLGFAISVERVMFTNDKRTFLKDSKAVVKGHFGIILSPCQFGNNEAPYFAKLALEKYLFNYDKDEWKNLVVYL